MIDLVTRREWGARAPRGSYGRLSSTRGVKVHYTGGHVSPDIVGDHARCVALVRSIQNHHMDGNGWIDVGYSMLVCPHRKVFEGRGPKHVPAANGSGLNSGHYAVLGMVGDTGLTEPPDDMLHGIVDAIEYLREKGGAGREVKGHRDGYSTTCPGDRLYRWVKAGARRPDVPEEKPVEVVVRDGVALWPGRVLELVDPMMRGEDVRAWQARLARRGWRIGVDGWYGSQSRTVCRSWQRAVGLPVTGKVDEATWESTWSWTKPSADEKD
ncbi:N-acetylmuramoyl-L-alanine amidase [Streptosporangium canum]|uniref:peptidoglycan recognition protein family protein n=1 Tax=Streptosporangium canum TaxID=324952 RepID=UPI0034465112